MARARHVISGALTLALLATSALADSPRARTPHQRPPDPGSEESGLWSASDRAEQSAKQSGELETDAALIAYVKGVECKVAAEYCDDVRLYVMDRPFFNAQAAPNGYIEVWTGLLLRARDEAELAFVLGHETTHFAFDHSLQAQRDLKNRANTAMAVGLVLSAGMMAGGAAVGMAPGGISNLNASLINIGYLGAIAGFFSFSREQETAADRGGFERLVAAGYAASAAPSIWQELIDEQSHSDFPKVRTEHARPNIFDSHPLEGDRLAALTGMAKGQTGGDLGVDRYRAAIRPHLAALLRDDLRRRDFGETLFIIDRLSADGGDAGVLGFFRGECYRQRRGDGDVAKAIAAYEAATAAADVPPETWRALGELYQQGHQAAQARAAFHAYLERAPAAQDRWLVEGELKKLDQLEGS